MSHFKIYPTKNYIKNPIFWEYQRFHISKIEKFRVKKLWSFFFPHGRIKVDLFFYKEKTPQNSKWILILTAFYGTFASSPSIVRMLAVEFLSREYGTLKKKHKIHANQIFEVGLASRNCNSFVLVFDLRNFLRIFGNMDLRRMRKWRITLFIKFTVSLLFFNESLKYNRKKKKQKMNRKLHLFTFLNELKFLLKI